MIFVVIKNSSKDCYPFRILQFLSKFGEFFVKTGTEKDTLLVIQLNIDDNGF